MPDVQNGDTEETRGSNLSYSGDPDSFNKIKGGIKMMHLTKGMNGNFHIVGVDEKPKPQISEKDRRRLKIELQIRMKVRRAREDERREEYFK